MVKLTQIDDETHQQFEQQQHTTSKSIIEDDFSEEDEEDSDIEDDFDFENETIYDRIVALKDIVPPEHRENIYKASTTLQNSISSIFNQGGKLLWVLTSSSLLLGVPLAMAILSETQLQEMEKDMSLQKSAQDVLAPGSEQAFDKKQ
ncbi:unnamed protein product [Candida verbasci]|uniref:Mitochondrial import receptor subunit tom22 n=1 Tax=Candida verbasci TaxID=1227364 RepID=A0A9W4TZH1_9ASCO|nr:unnamed protein product [Candida verbasci]